MGRREGNREHLSWAAFDLIDAEVREILKGLFGDDWREK